MIGAQITAEPHCRRQGERPPQRMDIGAVQVLWELQSSLYSLTGHQRKSLWETRVISTCKAPQSSGKKQIPSQPHKMRSHLSPLS